MKAAIMQPYFFPYVGYFSLMEYSDVFLFFDTPQYISHGWINRNRVLDAKGDPTYITVPVCREKQNTAINKIRVVENQKWIESIFGKLTIYKRRAPYYENTVDFLHYLFDSISSEYLSEINVFFIKKLVSYLSIKCNLDVISNMNMKIEGVNEPDDWALKISKYIGADEYVNPPGGKSFFNKEKYDNEGINLLFLESNLKPYIQRIGKWVPCLSIIDVMMFCNKNEIIDIIKDYSIS